MKKIILILSLVFFWLCTDIAFAKKLISLPDLNRPFSLLIGNDKLLITDGPVVYIHSLQDFSLLNKFGQAGEGPGEFKVIPSINQGSVVVSFKNDKIMVTSFGRISFFDLNGKFEEQKNIQSLFGFGIIKPFNNRYVGLGATLDQRIQYFTVNFFSLEFKKENEITRVIAFEPGKAINPVNIGIIPTIETDNKHIFFLDYQGIIHQFDSSGKKNRILKISSIDPDYSRVKVTPERIEQYISYFRSDPRFKAQFQRDQKNIKFPDYFPEIRDFRVEGNRIYAITFRGHSKLKELCALTEGGQLIKKIMVPIEEINPRELNPFTIRNNRLYQLVENRESDIWELHMITL